MRKNQLPGLDWVLFGWGEIPTEPQLLTLLDIILEHYLIKEGKYGL